MNVRGVLGAPITAIVFLLLSMWPASAVSGVLPPGWKLLGIPVALVVAVGFVHVHQISGGTLGDAGAYFFWVYTVAILVVFTGQLIGAAFDAASVTESVPAPLGNATFVAVVYLTAWWLVYRDGYVRIRPLNWSSNGRDPSFEQ